MDINEKNLESINDITKLKKQEKIEFDYDKFKSIITLFSKFICLYNKDYLYNETYLPSFTKDFWEFSKFAVEKNELYSLIAAFITVQTLQDDQQLVLNIDDLWILKKSGQYIKPGASNEINYKLVCSKGVLVKCVFRRQDQKKIYKKRYDEIKKEQILADIKKFIRMNTEA